MKNSFSDSFSARQIFNGLDTNDQPPSIELLTAVVKSVEPFLYEDPNPFLNLLLRAYVRGPTAKYKKSVRALFAETSVILMQRAERDLKEAVDGHNKAGAESFCIRPTDDGKGFVIEPHKKPAAG